MRAFCQAFKHFMLKWETYFTNYHIFFYLFIFSFNEGLVIMVLKFRPALCYNTTLYHMLLTLMSHFVSNCVSAFTQLIKWYLTIVLKAPIRYL